MDELGLDVNLAIPWFPQAQDTPYVLVRVGEVHARAWAEVLGVPVRRCYVTDALLVERAAALDRTTSDILAARLPDAGSTMAGDFGEILVYLYGAAKEHPQIALGPKKWRLKQDRTKPAPYSDVIHFVLPTWPTPSTQDVLLCSEVKTKSTDGATSPITAAIKDCLKDRTGRLAKTLSWLKERALVEDLGSVTLAHIDRFSKATDHPPASKHFRAIAVVCSSLLDGELADAPTETSPDYSVVVISVPELQRTYTEVFDAVRRSVLVPSAPALDGGSP